MATGRAPPPPPPLVLVLVLMLVAATSIDLAHCQQTISIAQNADCQLAPLHWNTTVSVGTSIRVTCNQRCTEKAVEENQRSSRDVVLRGTTVYSLDSDLCLAAIHDARLAYPFRWSGTTSAVELTVQQHKGSFPGSFRRGVVSERPRRRHNSTQPAGAFVSDRAFDPVPNVTVVYYNFRYDGEKEKISPVECYAPGRQYSSFNLYRSTGREYDDQRRKPDNESDDSASFRNASISSGSTAVCLIDSTLYSDTTAFGYVTNPYFKPSHKAYRGNLDENLEIEVKKTIPNSEIAWFKDGSETEVIIKGSRTPDAYMIASAKPADSGLYEARYKETQIGRALFSVIIRECPADMYGPGCRRRCPYCLHGGQCHGVTGQCVCPPGFYGERCQHSCDKGRFSADCSSTCSDDCEDKLLCVPEPYGCTCASGYRGLFCNEPCDRGTYGPDCVSSCGRCRDNGPCDRFTGRCEGGCQDGFDGPLCLDLSPWFRDPPALVQVGYTHLSITHAPWRESYDNGYGTGIYSYTIEFQRNDSADGSWRREDIWRQPPTNGNITLRLGDLDAETAYLVRMVIRDERRGTVTNDGKVPVIPVTTICQEPHEITSLEVSSITSTSASASIKPLSNEKEACAYKLQWTLSDTRTGVTVTAREENPAVGGGKIVHLRNLRPYTNYTFEVYAENGEGRSTRSSVALTTKEAPPSQVTGLSVTRLQHQPPELHHITWNPPRHANGLIRAYILVVKHLGFRACDYAQDEVEELSRNVTGTHVEYSVRHPFSDYSVSVTAVTVSLGPSATSNFASPPLAPSRGPSELKARWSETGVELSWTLPGCTTWNDAFSNIRVNVYVTGESAWNKGQGYTKVGRMGKNEVQVNDLTPYSNYSAEVSMNNSVGVSPLPQRVQFTTLQSRQGPGAPQQVVVATVTSTSLTVRWLPPTPPLCRITEYRVRCVGGSRCPPLYVPHDGPDCRPAGSLGPYCETVVDGLREVTTYTLQVSAYCAYVLQETPATEVEGKTQEGRPGPPEDVRLEGLHEKQLNISWGSPIQRNGVILHYELSYSLTDADDQRPLQTHRIDIGPENQQQVGRHQYVVGGLEPGRRYWVRVWASTSAGRGPDSSVWLETRVLPPELPEPPAVDAAQTTDSTVTLRLPPAAASDQGPAVSRYYVIVSEDLRLTGAEVEAYRADELPTADEASRRGISFYVAAVADPDHVNSNGTFVIGDGKYYNVSGKSYYNRPLKTGQTYRIGMAALSQLSADNAGLTFKAVEQPITVRAPNAVPAIVGSLFGILLLLLIVVGVIAFRRRLLDRLAQHGTSKPPEETPADEQMPMEDMYENGAASENNDDTYENLTSLYLNRTRVPLTELPSVAANTDLLRPQFSSLQLGLVRPCNYARLPQNRAKNRYGNLMPYDNSRVKLQKLEFDEYSDYINASYVDGYERPEAYIATQGPKPETIFDFWRMLWEKKAVRIVMVTNLVEGNKKKCDLYWPEESPLQLLNLTVTRESERMSSDFTIRTFTMVRGRERRKVTQLHYSAWPDHSVPLYPSSLARFIRELDAVPDRGGPTVVHCSAGVGRTGTVILIDAMHKMGRREQSVDVYRQLTIIREQRANLCASLQQYQLVHQVLVELLVAPSAAVPAAELAARLPQLKSVADGPSQLEQQLSFLASNPPPASYASARAEKLDGKNRSPEILPEDKSRVFLHGAGLLDSYVNAVFVHGFKKPDAFIATEAPLPARRGIFWHMIVQKQSQTIVVMNDLAPEDTFWPTTTEPETFGSVMVQLKNRITEPVETLDVTLHVFVKGQMDSSQEVRLFLLPCGASPDGLPSAEQLVVLHAAYERSLPNSYGGVTTVVCRTGVTGCGLFIVSSFVMDQLAEEQEVDVMLAVSTARKSRPQFIGSLKQYELCYDAALAWLKAFDIYANFQ